MNSDTKLQINKLRAELAKNDNDIEERERRIALCRQYGDRLYNRLVLLEAQLAREEGATVPVGDGTLTVKRATT